MRSSGLIATGSLGILVGVAGSLALSWLLLTMACGYSCQVGHHRLQAGLGALLGLVVAILGALVVHRARQAPAETARAEAGTEPSTPGRL